MLGSAFTAWPDRQLVVGEQVAGAVLERVRGLRVHVLERPRAGALGAPRRGCSRPPRRASDPHVDAVARVAAAGEEREDAQAPRRERSHCSIELVELAREDVFVHAAGPAAQDLPAGRDKCDERRLARRVVEPDLVVRGRRAAARGRAPRRSRGHLRRRRRGRAPSKRDRAVRAPRRARAAARCTSAQASHQLAVKTRTSGRSAQRSLARTGVPSTSSALNSRRVDRARRGVRERHARGHGPGQVVGSAGHGLVAAAAGREQNEREGGGREPPPSRSRV